MTLGFRDFLESQFGTDTTAAGGATVAAALNETEINLIVDRCEAQHDMGALHLILPDFDYSHSHGLVPNITWVKHPMWEDG